MTDRSDGVARAVEDQELIYVGDPMCSWCWGVAPELDELTKSRPDLGLRVVVGGLRPGPSAQMVDADMTAYLERAWEQVSQRSGQPFDRSLLERSGWLYDTEPACRAVVTMRELEPDLAFPFFKRIQHAFYAEGVLVSDTAVYADLVEGFDVDHDEFLANFATEEAVKATWQDFALARSWGINGFPTIVFRTGDTGSVIARGYSKATQMSAHIDDLTN